MKYLFPMLMSVLFIGILFFSNIYLSRRFGWILSLDNLKWLHFVFAFIPLFMFAGLIGFSNSSSVFGSFLYRFAAILTGVMLYLILSMLFADLVRAFYKMGPQVFGIISLTITLCVSGYGLWNASTTRVTHINIPIKGLHKELKVMHLSDIHLGHFRGKGYLQNLVDMTIRENPDIVVITGDLFDGKIQLKMETLEPLKQLNVPLFFVEGNHDGYSGVEEIKSLLRELGVKVLENEVDQFRELQIIGLNHMRADSDSHSVPPNPTDRSIRSVLAELAISPDRPSILLHHSPDGVQYANEHGVDLYLAGHTHAGQLFPINYLNDLLFKYNKGLSDYNGTKIFVSQGVGTFGPPMRLGTKGEIVLISLTS